jgi:DNA-binding LacI/PurR family transcriptional regulator
VSAKDVAELAGVSRAAVSRTFGDGQVSAKVRQRVVAAAEELGYRPNAIARSLIGGKSDIIALITAGRDSIHNTMLIEKLVLEVTVRGKRALVIPATSDTDIDESILNAADYLVDAIAVIGGTVSPEIVSRLSNLGVPIFLYERHIPDSNLECVVGDNTLGGRLAAHYLVRSGHAKPAMITKPLMTFSNKARSNGFSSGLKDAGVDLFATAFGEQGFDGGFSAAIEIFSARELPDAIFCFNDEMALGALQAATVMNLSVPGDVAIIGYDNIPMAGWPIFNLTTIHNAIDGPAKILLDRIFARIDGGRPEHAPHTIRPELIVRGTA